MTYAARTVCITYELPFGEVLFDFHDKLKSCRAARFDGLRIIGYRPDNLEGRYHVNGDPLDALSIIVHKKRSYPRGRAASSRVRATTAVRGGHQAAIGGKIIARETVRALQDVTAKIYGGDISRSASSRSRRRARSA